MFEFSIDQFPELLIHLALFCGLSSDGVLELSEAIKRFHDEVNLPPMVSIFLEVFSHTL